MPVLKSSVFQRFIRWRFLLAVNLVIILLLSLSFGREFIRSRSIESEIMALQAQAESLAVRNINISEMKTAMQTESFIEREARLKLGLKKPGETVVIIQDGTDSMNATQDTSGQSADPLGFILSNSPEETVDNPTRWWYYFFNKQQYQSLSTYE